MIPKEEKYLSSIYYNPKHPPSFSGPAKLLQVVRKEGKFEIGLSQIKKWLAAQETYTFYRGMRTKFKRNKVVVRGLDDQWDIDLMDMVSLEWCEICLAMYRYFITVHHPPTFENKTRKW